MDDEKAFIIYDDEKALIIYEYEELLTGSKSNGLSYVRSHENPQKCVRIIMQYAITEILKWTPEQAVKYMSREVIEKLSLTPVLKLIDIDLTKVYVGDMSKILQYVFPEQIRYNFKKDTIDSYNRSVCAEQYKYTVKEKHALPRSFWADADGEKRASIILNYLTGKYMGDMSVEERYNFFATKEKSVKWLKDNNINGVIGTIFDNPLEYYHEAISPEYRNNDLYDKLKANKE